MVGFKIDSLYTYKELSLNPIVPEGLNDLKNISFFVGRLLILKEYRGISFFLKPQALF